VSGARRASGRRAVEEERRKDFICRIEIEPFKVISRAGLSLVLGSHVTRACTSRRRERESSAKWSSPSAGSSAMILYSTYFHLVFFLRCGDGGLLSTSLSSFVLAGIFLFSSGAAGRLFLSLTSLASSSDGLSARPNAGDGRHRPKGPPSPGKQSCQAENLKTVGFL